MNHTLFQNNLKKFLIKYNFQILEQGQSPKILSRVAQQLSLFYKKAHNDIISGEKISSLKETCELCATKKNYYEVIF